MRRRPVLALATGLASVALVAPTPGHAEGGHDVRGQVTRRGLDFLTSEVPRYVPRRLTPPPLSKQVGCVTATQRDTDVQLRIDEFRMTIPREGRLSIDLELTMSGTGELHADDVITCNTDLTCQDSFHANAVRASLDLDVALRSGAPEISVAAVDVELAPGDFDLDFSGCAPAGLVNWVIDFAKGTIVDVIVGELEKAAAEQIAPKVEELLTGLGYDGSVGSVEFAAAIDELLLTSSGIALGATIDVTNRYPAADCVADLDPGDPGDLTGDPPDLATNGRTHVALAANLGLLNDALYHIWRQGLMCLADAELAALGLEIPLDAAAEALPGFPAGSELGLELFLAKPIVVLGQEGEGAEADAARLTLAIRDLQVTLVGRPPAGEERRVRVDVAAIAEAAVGIDPGTNALVAHITDIEITRLELDQVYASEFGFDVNKLRDLVANQIVPRAVEEIGAFPITGPVFTAAGYAIILRHLATNAAYLKVESDLFPIPTDDHDPPTTSVLRYPRSRVKPDDAIVEVSAVDARVPLELLQYRVTVDGILRPATFVREFKVGQPGVTDTYAISVAAADLSGNVDPTPATISVMVDGVAPKVALLGPRIRDLDGPIDLAWAASDDLTASEDLGLRLEVYRVTDQTDLLSAERFETRVLPPGTTTAIVEDLPLEALYRIEIHTTDEVGNDASASVLVDLRSGGCAAGGGAAGGGLLVGLALVGLAARRRRR